MYVVIGPNKVPMQQQHHTPRPHAVASAVHQEIAARLSNCGDSFYFRLRDPPAVPGIGP